MLATIYKYFFKVLILILLFPVSINAYNINELSGKEESVPDSILQNIFTLSPSYSKLVDEYKGELYLKGLVKVHKKNIFLRYVPSMFKIEKGRKEYIIESVSDIHYTSPNIYERKIKALSSTFIRNKGQFLNLMDLAKMNIYSSSLMTNRFLSPLNKINSRHYKYILDSVYVDGGCKRYKIIIKPKLRGTQLVDGYIVVSDNIWSIREVYFEGIMDMITFKFNAIMGEEGSEEELLPVRIALDGDFKFLKNHISFNGSARIKYNMINFSRNLKKHVRKNKHHHDLSNSYQLTSDTTGVINDMDAMKKMRHVELSFREDSLYGAFLERKKQKENMPQLGKNNKRLINRVGNALTSNYYIDFSDYGKVRCSPLLNPMMFSYNHSNGYSYKQKFKYNRLLDNGKTIKIVPLIGYNFTHKELYAKIDAEFQYYPQKQGHFSVSVGNGNRIFSSVVEDKLKEFPDSLIDFRKNDFDYFKDMHCIFYHSIEPVNGLTVQTGISMHWRRLINKSGLSINRPMSNQEWSQLRGIGLVYNTFSPRIRIEWTPGMYYYMNGNRKINLGSSLPTFSVDYEKGIKGIFGANTSHERIEFDIQQKFVLNGLSSIGYRLGGGFFTNQKDVYFVDYANFSRRNLPEGWNDNIGGTFQLLAGDWYNSSSQYWRGNVSYESPFILLRPLYKICAIIQHERIYGGILFMPHLNPYVEVGYGIGTHIFDFGFFVSSIKGKYDTVGVKFTFALFE